MNFTLHRTSIWVLHVLLFVCIQIMLVAITADEVANLSLGDFSDRYFSICLTHYNWQGWKMYNFGCFVPNARRPGEKSSRQDNCMCFQKWISISNLYTVCSWMKQSSCRLRPKTFLLKISWQHVKWTAMQWRSSSCRSGDGGGDGVLDLFKGGMWYKSKYVACWRGQDCIKGFVYAEFEAWTIRT